MHRGYIKLWRKSFEDELWNDFMMWRVFETCLFLAAYKETSVKMNRNDLPIKLNPGQFITGQYEFHKKAFPKKNKYSPSSRTTWRWLKSLENDGKLTIKTSNKYSIITIVKWDTYQNCAEPFVKANVKQMSNRCQQRRMLKNIKENRDTKVSLSSCNSTPPEKETFSKKEKIPYAEIINRLNEKSGSGYKVKSKHSRKLIKARMNEGFTLDDFITVIDHRCKVWGADDKMVEYLRPQTLFTGKFEGYLEAAKRNGHGKGTKAPYIDTKIMIALDIRADEGEQQFNGFCKRNSLNPEEVLKHEEIWIQRNGD